MSRSYNQKSIPITRGRKTVGIKTKRRSSKLIRSTDVVDGRTERILRNHFLIDKDNKSYQNFINNERNSGTSKSIS